MIQFLKRGSSGGGSEMNLFIQNDQPEGYDGIWIKSDSLGISNITEVADKQSLVASSINIVKGTAFETILFDSDVQNGVHYKFKEVYLTNNNNDIIYDMPTYYGDGQSWVDITNKSITILQYIESSGTQYINTGINVNSELTMEADVQFLTTANGQSICGTSTGTSSDYGRFGLYKDYERIFNYYDNQARYPNTTYEIGNEVLNRHTYALDKNVAKLDGATKVTFVKAEFSNNFNVFVFAGSNANNEPRFKSSIKLYGFKLYNNDELVRDFIPVKDNNNVVCLYDDISKQFFYNQGTGTFIAGPEA